MTAGPDTHVEAAQSNVDLALKRQLLLYADRMVSLANHLRRPDDDLDAALTNLQLTLARAVAR